MGLFDNFMSNKMKEKKFLNYIKSYSKNDLMYVVNDVYREMKGVANLAPYMGEFGSIEFAGVMLMWRYASISFQKDKELYTGFLMALADHIGCAFNHMGALEWSDRLDNIINNFPGVMSYPEWRDTYDYLKENYADEIRACEFNKNISDRISYDNLYKGFVELYNQLSNRIQLYNYFEKQGLGIKRALYDLL